MSVHVWRAVFPLLLFFSALMIGSCGHFLMRRKLTGAITFVYILSLPFYFLSLYFYVSLPPILFRITGFGFVLGTVYRVWNTKIAVQSATFCVIVISQLLCFPLIYLATTTGEFYHLINWIGFMISFVPFLFHKHPQKNCIIALTSMSTLFTF